MKLAFALLLATLCGSAAAQKVAPGLWENSMTMKSAGGQTGAALARMQEQMARMPPEQRKQMETMMANQGMQMGAGPGQPILVKVCVTPEQAARDELAPPDANCTVQNRQRSGNTLRFKFVCSGERQASGEGEYTFASDKQHTGKVVVTTIVSGKPERMEMEHSGRWLGANCGDVKPRP